MLHKRCVSPLPNLSNIGFQTCAPFRTNFKLGCTLASELGGVLDSVLGCVLASEMGCPLDFELGRPALLWVAVRP
jgi:hypothetical protein